MEKRTSIEEKVLDYWFTLEFLGQDKYPGKELTEAGAGAKKLKARLAKGQKGYKAVSDFFEIDPPFDFYGALEREAEQCRMKSRGNITVYIGKVRREACIECIARRLPAKKDREQRPEKSSDRIACLCLQLSPQGHYIERSLSLSTIVWAMRQVKNGRGNLSDCLSQDEYRSEVSGLEKMFFPEPEDAAPSAAEPELFVKLYDYVEKEYLRGSAEPVDGKESFEMALGVFLQLFEDEEAKSREEDDTYCGLGHDFFSNDLRMLLDKIRCGDPDVPEHVLSYITGTYEASQNPEGRKRIDLVHPSDRRTFANQVQEILNVRNAPLGKWPSKFMPAFMQQIAVNLAIHRGGTPLFGENGAVFSVNGPPGTGKTTLLKEIIVNNIVERAHLLSKYDDPEDAFCEHSFLRGPRDNNAYSKYTQHWYSLKEDRINDYSILVTSCNNAAVENISKELPLGSGIIKDLKPFGSESQEEKAALLEVSGLFDVSRTQETECYEKNSVECPEIYFTYYAQKLLEEKNAWGLVAASLGKKKNIRDFYRAVLAPMRWDFYPARDSAANRLPRYLQAREQFLEQEKRVRGMQEQIAQVCDLAVEKSRLERETERQERAYRQFCASCAEEKERIGKALEEIRVRIASQKEVREEILERTKALEAGKARLELEWNGEKEKCAALRREAFDVINSVGRKPLFIGKAEYKQKLEYARKAAKGYEEQAARQERRTGELAAGVLAAQQEWEAARTELMVCDEALNALRERLCALEREMGDLERELASQKRQAQECRRALEETAAQYRARLSVLGDAGELGGEFIDRLLSERTDLSTQAQVENPWFTRSYNREREKLFYCAMQMNREFILSSKKCRDNFTSLAHYWGLQPGDEKEKVVFCREDREACAGALYQTLFLLVPVISTTFASVGSFLGDVRRSRMIGTLIVDEAGQAQPQMAAGALYRSRRAVIVGDPKQVEPVVTDDLDLLKRAFQDVELRPYTSGGSLSVQSCADELNCFGTWLNNADHPDFPDWVGCPLLVHRRCISPMYEISNAISYNGIMKQKTGQPSKELAETFLLEKSQWVQTAGKEKGNKNHFNESQGDKVCEMLETAFARKEFPSLYIISPFTSVVSGIRAHIREHKRKRPDGALAKSRMLDDWMGKNIGTVHTFQGKEANEVIFLLGCDGSSQAAGAVRWVNSNIVNVAATRAKFRLYIVGDAAVWSSNENVNTAKNIMDTYAIREIHSILADDGLDEAARAKALSAAARDLPPVTAFPMEEAQSEGESADYSVDTQGLISGLEAYDFMKTPFTQEQLDKFGFTDREKWSGMSMRVKKNLEFGMRLYYFLQPVYEVCKGFDASCCAILFCKALEMQMKERLKEGIGMALPDCEIRGKGRKVRIRDARPDEMTLGTFRHVISQNSAELGRRMAAGNAPAFDENWWEAFAAKLASCTEKRNQCCHDGLFEWKDLSRLLADMFRKSEQEPRIGGLVFESGTAGRILTGDPDRPASAGGRQT